MLRARVISSRKPAENGEARIQHFPYPREVADGKTSVTVEWVIPWEGWKPVKETVKAYIAGFLDGDGSIMLQMKPREDCRFGYRLYSTVRLYQDVSQETELRWIADQLKIGCFSERNDGMLEYRIDGHENVAWLLRTLEPYVRFKKRQVSLMLQALENLEQEQTPELFLETCKIADALSESNYHSAQRKHSAKLVETVLRERGFLPL